MAPSAAIIQLLQFLRCGISCFFDPCDEWRSGARIRERTFKCLRRDRCKLDVLRAYRGMRRVGAKDQNVDHDALQCERLLTNPRTTSFLKRNSTSHERTTTTTISKPKKLNLRKSHLQSPPPRIHGRKNSSSFDKNRHFGCDPCNYLPRWIYIPPRFDYMEINEKTPETTLKARPRPTRIYYSAIDTWWVVACSIIL